VLAAFGADLNSSVDKEGRSSLTYNILVNLRWYLLALGNPAVYIAADRGDLQSARVLFAFGADLNKTNSMVLLRLECIENVSEIQAWNCRAEQLARLPTPINTTKLLTSSVTLSQLSSQEIASKR